MENLRVRKKTERGKAGRGGVGEKAERRGHYKLEGGRIEEGRKRKGIGRKRGEGREGEEREKGRDGKKDGEREKGDVTLSWREKDG